MKSGLFLIVLALGLAGAVSASPPASHSAREVLTPPQRIVSLNLCTDQLLLELVATDRLLMLSQLAADTSLSWNAAKTGDIPRFDGSVERIMALHPDLVVAGSQASYGPVATLRRAGVRVEVVEMPETIEGSLELIDTVAKLAGAPEAGARLATQTRQRLDAVKTSNNAVKAPLAVIYLPNGLSPGPGTLKHALVELAGFRNLAAELGFDGYGTISIETLMRSKPELVILDSADLEHASLAQQLLQHPALVASGKGRRVFNMPTPFWICAGPQIADAAEALQAARVK